MRPPPGTKLDLELLVQEAIRHGTLNIPVDDEQYTPLSLISYAAIWGRFDLLERLLEAGAVVTAHDIERAGWWSGDEAVLFLLDHAVPLETAHWIAALRPAMHYGLWGRIDALLDHGMDIKTKIALRNETTMSLLHIAVWQGVEPLMRRCLEGGVDVDERDGEGFTPLMKACHFRRYNREDSQGHSPEVVSRLLSYGANANAVTPEGETPLVLCMGEGSGKAAYASWRVAIAQMLLRHGADPNIASPAGTTPLMFAARDNQEALARALIQAGARTETRSPDGLTALDVAIKWKSDAVRLLLEAEAH